MLQYTLWRSPSTRKPQLAMHCCASVLPQIPLDITLNNVKVHLPLGGRLLTELIVNNCLTKSNAGPRRQAVHGIHHEDLLTEENIK